MSTLFVDIYLEIILDVRALGRVCDEEVHGPIVHGSRSHELLHCQQGLRAQRGQVNALLAVRGLLG